MKNHTRYSKFLSLVLRHKPEEIGIQPDRQGWVPVDDLINKMTNYGKEIDLEMLEEIVQSNSKKRFAFSEDGSKIRASQGHSIEVELDYESKKPPAILYHGTAVQHIDSIYTSGIQARGRHQVHLSKDIQTAESVGRRHGQVRVLEVMAEEMYKEGFVFYKSANGVWLCDFIPVRFIRKL